MVGEGEEASGRRGGGGLWRKEREEGERREGKGVMKGERELENGKGEEASGRRGGGGYGGRKGRKEKGERAREEG